MIQNNSYDTTITSLLSYSLGFKHFFGMVSYLHLTTPTGTHPSIVHPSLSPIHRIIFGYFNADGWRDDPGFNAYFLHDTLPSISVEHKEDWNDRISATHSNTRAWCFPFVLIAGRSAAHRGIVCGSQTQRTAAKAWEYMRLKRKLKGLHLEFAGVDIEFHNFGNLSPSSVDLKAHVDPSDSTPIVNISPSAQNQLPMPSKIVLTYIDRQTANSSNPIGLDQRERIGREWSFWSKST